MLSLHCPAPGLDGRDRLGSFASIDSPPSWAGRAATGSFGREALKPHHLPSVWSCQHPLIATVTVVGNFSPRSREPHQLKCLLLPMQATQRSWEAEKAAAAEEAEALVAAPGTAVSAQAAVASAGTGAAGGGLLADANAAVVPPADPTAGKVRRGASGTSGHSHGHGLQGPSPNRVPDHLTAGLHRNPPPYISHQVCRETSGSADSPTLGDKWSSSWPPILSSFRLKGAATERDCIV